MGNEEKQNTLHMLIKLTKNKFKPVPRPGFDYANLCTLRTPTPALPVHHPMQPGLDQVVHHHALPDLLVQLLAFTREASCSN